jgi:hypothetical protein
MSTKFHSSAKTLKLQLNSNENEVGVLFTLHLPVMKADVSHLFLRETERGTLCVVNTGTCPTEREREREREKQLHHHHDNHFGSCEDDSPSTFVTQMTTDANVASKQRETHRDYNDDYADDCFLRHANSQFVDVSK